VSRLLKLQTLPEEKRTQILAAIAGPEPQEFDEAYFLMKQALFPGVRWTQEVLDVLHNPQDRDFSASVARWLEHTASSHELVGILAEDPDPGIRTLVLGALRSCPTSANRRILAKLLEDPDSAVQEGAIQVQKELQELATTPPSAFASNATTFSATEAGRYLTSKLDDKQE
jgi:hypothetical protein